jgi:hypothetical protein
MRAWRWPLLVIVLALVGVLATASLTDRSLSGDLDIDSAYPSGSRALAQILRDQGVDVRQIRSPEELSGAGTGTTVAVVNPELLGPEELDRLAQVPSDLVLIEPTLATLSTLAPFAQVAGRVQDVGTVAPRCQDPDAVAAGEISAGGITYRITDPEASSCYEHDDASGTGTMVRGRDRDRSVTVLGQADLVRNDHLALNGNAALTLRVLGSQDQLLWFRPDPLALSADAAPELTDLLPDWVRWVPVQLLIAAIVAIAWRARRLGPLVTEPLPVIVRAAETQEGRARLYREVRANHRTAATLRTATARRLVARLDIPANAGPEYVSAAVADLTGRPDRTVRAILFGPAPTDDAQLLQLAADLDGLERAADPSGSPKPSRSSPSADSTTARKAEST